MGQTRSSEKTKFGTKSVILEPPVSARTDPEESPGADTGGTEHGRKGSECRFFTCSRLTQCGTDEIKRKNQIRNPYGRSATDRGDSGRVTGQSTDLNPWKTNIFVPNSVPVHKMISHYETHDSMRWERVWRKNGVFMAPFVGRR